jgi:hypothetical protein
LSVRSARRLLFVVIALTVPVPMLGPFDALAPPLRYLILFSASGAVAAAEGAAGPIPAILALFGGHALVALGLAWLAAWVAARLLTPLSPQTRRRAVLSVCGAMILAALVFELYRTPFGRAPTANLLGVLS